MKSSIKKLYKHASMKQDIHTTVFLYSTNTKEKISEYESKFQSFT